MSDDENKDTLPPEAPPSDFADNLFGMFEAFGDLVNDFRDKTGDDSGRPPELYVRWKKVEGGVEITSCTVHEILEPPCAEGEFQGRFR